jgi:hypothetical protein
MIIATRLTAPSPTINLAFIPGKIKKFLLGILSRKVLSIFSGNFPRR